MHLIDPSAGEIVFNGETVRLATTVFA